MRSLTGIVKLVAAMLAFAVILFSIWTSWLARQAQIAETQTKAANLEASVTQQAERSLESADIVLRDALDHIDSTDTEHLRVLLSRRAAELAQVAAFGIVGADGHVLVSSTPGGEGVDVSDRPYYLFHRDHPDAGLHISGPLIARGTGRYVFVASRPIRTADKKFAGVATAAMDMRFFQEFYDGLNIGEQGIIVLHADDGTILVRHPYLADSVGRNFAGPLTSQYLSQSSTSVVRTVSPIDGIVRWNARARLDNCNLYISAALSEAEELAPWREQAMWQGIVLAVILLGIFGLGAHLLRQIGERAQAQERAAANAAQYKLLADNSTDVIIRVGFDGVRKYASPSAALLLGYSAQEMVGRGAVELVHPDDRPQLLAAWESIRLGEGEQILSYRVHRKDGSWIWVETTLSGVQDPATGRPIEMVAVVRDVTTRKAMEQRLVDTVRDLENARDVAEEATQAKTQFLATMSHEIRTPLNGVLGFSELLQRTELAAEQRRFVELQLEAGKTLLAIIGDLLDFSTLEAGKLTIERAPVALAPLIEGCVEWFRKGAEEKGLDLACTIAEELPPFVMLDGARLQQILANLLSNALKFTRAGKISLVARRVEIASGPRLSIAVRDSGIGIPDSKIGLLFERFSQLDGSINREFGGTGLGLAISQRMAQLMGGGIRVASELGAGSMFTLDLPLDRAATPQEAAVPVVEPANRSGVRLLLVEDNRTNQKLIEALLAEIGYAIDIVDNGEEGVRAVSEGRYDLVLMDVQMPVMDGLRATALIRELGGPAGRVPIIALTAHVRVEDIQRCMAAGMDGHVGKPINRNELLTAIASRVGKTAAA